jgi:uncharacterized membrane protein YcaP (DUF421 family)
MTQMSQAFDIPIVKELFQIVIASLLLSVVCFFIVRIGGKKSVSQMTMPQFIMMISVGSIIVQPLAQSRTIVGTYIAVFIFVMTQIILEFINIKFSKAEPVIDSVPKVLIKDGQLQVNTLRKERITVDELEALLRTKGIGNINDVRTCTIEVDGNIGYEKKKGKDNLTYDDFVSLLDLKLKSQMDQQQKSQQQRMNQNLFDEVRDGYDKKNDNTPLD